MEPEFEKNEVREGATLKQWRRPELRKLAISATEGKKGRFNEGMGGGKAIPHTNDIVMPHTISLENLLTFESNCQDVREFGLTQRLTGQ